jgi:mRNA-degrading endonuclease toxin of MazEF toxin-antitoxin module
MVSRGDVRWGPHSDSSAYRPWLVVSVDEHPFAAEECIAVALTTTPHDEGVPVPDDAWTAGGSRKQPYVSPWYVTTIKHRTFDRHQGRLEAEFLTWVVERLHSYVPARVE